MAFLRHYMPRIFHDKFIESGGTFIKVSLNYFTIQENKLEV